MEFLLGLGAVVLLFLPYKVANVLETKIADKFNAYPNDWFVNFMSYFGAAAFFFTGFSVQLNDWPLPIFIFTNLINIAWVVFKHKVPAAYGGPFAVCLTITAVLGILWKIAKIAFNSNFSTDLKTSSATSIRSKNRSVELQRQGYSAENAMTQANQEDLNAQLNSKKYSNPQGDGPL